MVVGPWRGRAARHDERLRGRRGDYEDDEAYGEDDNGIDEDAYEHGTCRDASVRGPLPYD